MAVKPKRIKERIRVLFPKANLSQSRINALSVKLSKKPAKDAEDDDLDEIINDFNEIFSFTQIAKEDDQKRSADKKIADLEKDVDEEEEEEENPEDKKGKGKGKTQKGTDTIPAWAQKLIDQNKKLSDKVEKFETSKVEDLKTAEARKVFESSEAIKKLPEPVQKRLFKTLDLNNEENTIEDQIVEMEEEFVNFTDATDSENEIPGMPPIGTGKKGPSEKEIEEIEAML